MKAEVNGYKVEIPDPPVVEGWEAVEYRCVARGEWFSSGDGIFCRFQDGITVEPRWIMRRVPKLRRVVRFVECEERTQFADTKFQWWTPYLSTMDRIVHIRAYEGDPRDRACWLRREDSTEEVEG